jgi:formate dehydrogenase alpha subunit
VNKISLTINDKSITTVPGKTILETARAHGIHIPTLCHDPRLKPYGACRICLVEVEGAKSFVPACATVATEGMVVRTDTIAVYEIRRTIVELLLSDHPLDCLTCESAGRCRLQDLAYELNIKEKRYKGEKHSYTVEDFNPFIERDHNKCVLCGRCVRICAETQGCHIFDFANRGFETVTSTPFDRSLQETPCVFCGQCVSTCPVGALTSRLRKYKGRIWETVQTVTTCPYCGVGCRLRLYAKNGEVIGVSADLESGVNRGNLCIKGRFGYGFINHPDRLTSPLIKKDGEFVEASWEEALQLVAGKLSEVREKHGADAIGGLSSAKCTNEENYLFQKFMRAVVGTNNVDHCARLCHASTVVGLAQAFGSGAMTNSIDDLAEARAILVIGSNTTEAHPVIALEIKKAVAQGASLIVIDPRRIELAGMAEVWLSQKPGSDVAVLNGLAKVILDEDLVDAGFVKERTEGFEEFSATLTDYTPEEVEKISGVPSDELRRAARVFATAERASIIYSMGITQHTTGTDNVLAIANLAMMTGNIGTPGTGVNPLRGQNNVQGACDMGALPNVFSGYQRVDLPDMREKFEKAWGVSLPGNIGLTLTEMTGAAEEGRIKALYIMGENPMLSDPDLTHVERALKNLDFLVVQDIFMTETAELADVVLPGVSFAEKDGTFTNTERRVQRVRKAINPIGEAKPDWQIICELAEALGCEMKYGSTAEIMTEINELTPSYAGILYERIEKEGLQWPCPANDHPGTPILHVSSFTRGKGKFSAVAYKAPAEMPDREFPLVLTTGRLLSQYHTGTMARRSPGIDEVTPLGRVEINPTDAKKHGIREGDPVNLVTRRGKVVAKALVTERVPQGVLFVPFHFKEVPANILTNSALDPIAKIPEFKVCAVRIEKIKGPRGQGIKGSGKKIR